MAQQQQQQTGAAAAAPPAGRGAGGVPGVDLTALQNNPQIQQLRELMQQNPALIQPLIQQLAQSNPQLADAFARNPEALMQLLGGAEGADAEGEIPPGAHVVSVTPEERAAIERVRFINIFPLFSVVLIIIIFVARGTRIHSAGSPGGVLCL